MVRFVPRSARLLATFAVGLSLTLVTPPAARAGSSSAPALTGKATDGSSFRLDRQRGHWVVVAFQAEWCVPCRNEVKELRKLRTERPDITVVTVGYASSMEETSRFVKRLGITWPAVPDPEGRIGERWAVAGLPATAIVDPQGKIAKRFVGGLTAARIVAVTGPARPSTGKDS